MPLRLEAASAECRSSATITWQTSQAATSRIDYSTDPVLSPALTLTKTAKTDLAKAGKLGATVKVVYTTDGQHDTTGTAKLTLRKPKK